MSHVWDTEWGAGIIRFTYCGIMKMMTACVIDCLHVLNCPRTFLSLCFDENGTTPWICPWSAKVVQIRSTSVASGKTPYLFYVVIAGGADTSPHVTFCPYNLFVWTMYTLVKISNTIIGSNTIKNTFWMEVSKFC